MSHRRLAVKPKTKNFVLESERCKNNLKNGLTALFYEHAFNYIIYIITPKLSERSKALLSKIRTECASLRGHGLAQIMRYNWYKEVTIKSFDNHESRALFRTRSNLVSMRTDVVNQIRGMLKTFGILIKGNAGVGRNSPIYSEKFDCN